MEDIGLTTIPSTEKFNTSDITVALAVKQSTILRSRQELIDSLQPGDMILTYKKRSTFNLFSKLFDQVSGAIQKSSFVSIKTVAMDGKHIYGFGANNIANTFVKVDKAFLIDSICGCLVLRYNKTISPNKRILLDKWMDARVEKIDYSYSDIFKGIGNMISKGVSDYKLTKQEAKEFYGPMFCSTIFAVGYKACGIDIGIPYTNILQIWPYEFLHSKNYTPVVSYFDKGEEPDETISRVVEQHAKLAACEMVPSANIFHNTFK